MDAVPDYNVIVTDAIPAPVETDVPDVQDLIARSRQGDPEAFCTLYRTFEGRLLRQPNAFCGDQMLAEDLSQEVLFQAWKGLRRYNGQCQFFTWLCAILLHRSRSFLRQRRPLPFSTLLSGEQESAQDLLDNLPDHCAGPDQCAQISERAAFLLRRVQWLPPKHQEVVFLRFYVDTSLESIAAALGCSVGTVKSRHRVLGG